MTSMFSSRLSAVLLCQISYLHLFHCQCLPVNGGVHSAVALPLQCGLWHRRCTGRSGSATRALKPLRDVIDGSGAAVNRLSNKCETAVSLACGD